MVKLNNKGITLIELLVSLAILSIFMITVNFFVTAATNSSKQTKQQVNVQRDAQDVYDTLYDAVIQAPSIDIKTTKRISATASGEAVASGDAEDKARKTAGFESGLSAGTGVYLVSRSAFDSMQYAKNNFSSSSDYKTAHPNVSVSKAAEYEKDTLGNILEKGSVVSVAQYVGAVGVLDGIMQEYAAYDGGEYDVDAIAIGPVSPKSGETVCNTIVRKDKKIYLNRTSDTLDFTKYDKNLIADNCTEFTVTVPDGSSNSLKLKLTFSDGGYSYTVGGTINLRNAGVMK